MADAEDDRLIGKLVGGYRIESVLGRGGMGVVYLAVHPEIRKLIAVKILAARLSGQPRYRERFFREAKACSDVQHPGLVQIFGYGELQDDTLYILMEFLEGESLDTRLKQATDQRLPVASALSITQLIADAMQAAHQHHVVHRDLKPDNILLVSDSVVPLGERPKVLDFGIAKFVGPAAPPTIETQGLIGTPFYMAPERCRGDEQIDGKSDVYALGCMLYEMLCGRRPFVGDDHDVMLCHIGTDPVSPRHRRPELPATIDELVLRMLAKVPVERPNMAEVSAALKLLQSNPDVRSNSGSKPPNPGIKIAMRWIMPIFILAAIVWIALTLYQTLATPAMILVDGGSFFHGKRHSGGGESPRLGPPAR